MTEAAERDGKQAAGDRLRPEDVEQAYRWVLGREPESRDVVERRIANVETKALLRRRLIRSEEFRKQFDALAVEAPPSPDRYLPPEVDRLVLLHVPKTGGTTIHVLLAAAVGRDRVSAERHNQLWRCSGAELASARLFSGHYDRRCLSLIPRRGKRMLLQTGAADGER